MMKQPSHFLLAGAVLSFLGVGLGAFGAHALRSHLTENFLVIFETAVRYQMFHALALLMTGILIHTYQNKFILWAGKFFLLGTLIFSGSLYLLVFSGIKKWGAVTPIGGTLLLVGWLSLCAAFVKPTSLKNH